MDSIPIVTGPVATSVPALGPRAGRQEPQLTLRVPPLPGNGVGDYPAISSASIAPSFFPWAESSRGPPGRESGSPRWRPDHAGPVSAER